MNVFYHVWLVNGGTPTRQKNMKQMSSLGVWSSCVKIPAPMSNHGHGTQEPFQWEIHLKKMFFCCELCEELKSRYIEGVLSLLVKVCGYTSTVPHLGLEYLVLFKK